MKLFNCSPPVLSLCFFLSHLLAASIHWFSQFCCEATKCPSPQCFFYISSSWPKFAYVANPFSPETRCMTCKLYSQRSSRFHFSILPVLYTQDTFAPFRTLRSAVLLVTSCFFLCGYERNLIHPASLSHFIFSFTRFITWFFFIQLWTVTEFT